MTSNESILLEAFNCQNCGDCCQGYGGTFVSQEDIDCIAKYIRVDPAHFFQKYCQLSGGHPIIAQNEKGFCIFWDGLCTIHDVKPRMCRQWPYLTSVLKDTDNWYIMANSCPGINKTLTKEQIQKVVKHYLGESF